MSAIVCIIAMTKAAFEQTKKRYTDAGGSLPVIHIPGIRASAEQRKSECEPVTAIFGTTPMIGIGLAHRQAWMTCKASGCSFAFIYEEDVHFAQHFNEKIIL